MITNLDVLEPILDVHEIQGNVLAGFNKDHQTLLGLLIRNKGDAKQWIQSFSNRISALYEVHNFNMAFKTQRKRLKEPEDMKATWINIAFSFNGLKLLVDDTDIFESDLDKRFKQGLYKRSSTLGDPIDKSSQGCAENWEVGEEKTGKHPVPDILLIIASDSPDILKKEIEDIKKTLSGTDLEIVYDETGHDLSHYDFNKKGKEHFGFKDGISQPAIRGRMSSKTDDFLTVNRNDDISLENNDRKIEYTSNGRPLIAPGEFVLGYPTQNENFPRVANPVPESFPELLKNCSYLVFRKLRQDVKAFEEFSKSESERLSSIEHFTDISPEKIKALFVGRWPSGSPLALSPNSDNEAIASDSNKNNKFNYTDDENGYRTPYFSHIRKLNPREIDTEEGSFTKTLTRRILRRGIPYGSLYDPLVLDDNNDRGLLFLSYQSSIESQFEFLMKEWANTAVKPPSPPSPSGISGGHDLLIGQTNETNSLRVRHGNLMRKINEQTVEEKITNEKSSIKDWVIPRGGGYFFVPSISLIKKIGKDGRN